MGRERKLLLHSLFLPSPFCFSWQIQDLNTALVLFSKFFKVLYCNWCWSIFSLAMMTKKAGLTAAFKWLVVDWWNHCLRFCWASWCYVWGCVFPLSFCLLILFIFQKLFLVFSRTHKIPMQLCSLSVSLSQLIIFLRHSHFVERSLTFALCFHFGKFRSWCLLP